MSLSLQQVILEGESDAKAGQYALIMAGIAFLCDIVVFGIMGATSPWLALPIVIAEIVGLWGAFYYMFATLSNIFAVSRASASHNMSYAHVKAS